MNGGWIYRDRVERSQAGQTVLAYYADRYRHSSAAEWRDRLAAGQIYLEGQPAQPDTILQRGQRLAYHRPPWQEPEVPLAFDVIYEDADLVVVAKPSGLPVLPAGGFLEHTLWWQLQQRYPQAPPVPIHRLGRGTSGLVLLARSPLARRHLSQQLRDRQIHKQYLALASGNAPADEFTLDTPIGPCPHPQLGLVYGAIAPPTEARAAERAFARSDCRVLWRGGDRMLLAVTILTGRPHQIRIHLAAAGFPLLGDPLYGPGGRPIADPALPGAGGYHLHAHILGFCHPTTGQAQQVVCPAPPALQMPCAPSAMIKTLTLNPSPRTGEGLNPV